MALQRKLPTELERSLVNAGWQCPECHGVQITTRGDAPWGAAKFGCQDCGCCWHSDYYPQERTAKRSST